MAVIYKAAIEKTTDKDALKALQIEWLKQQRACKDAECLTQTYQARITQLNSSSSVVAQSTSSTTTPKPTSDFKKPLTFKLAFGDSYPICQPYVNMLNEAKYDSNPVCERKILPEFPQFKALQWTEITHKQEMMKIMEENLRIQYAFYTSNREAIFKRSWDDIQERIESGSFKLYFSEFDIDKDGKKEKIYKGTSIWGGVNGEAEKRNLCNIHNNLYIRDEKITLDNIPTKYSHVDPYSAIDFTGHNDLFATQDEHLFVSHWTGKTSSWTSGDDIKIYALPDKLVCSINILQ